MNPYQLFQTDKQTEQGGLEIDYGDFQIRIARAGGSNERFSKEFTERMNPYRTHMTNGTMDNKVAERIMAEVYADTVILGWRSQMHGDGVIPGADDSPMEFNRENVIKILLDIPDMFRDIQLQASKISNFRASGIMASEKN